MRKIFTAYSFLLCIASSSAFAQSITFKLANELDRYACKSNEVEFVISSATTCPAGNTCTYYWNFGDGTAIDSTNNTNITHTYSKDGKHSVTLTVKDTAANLNNISTYTLSSAVTIYNPDEAEFIAETVDEDSSLLFSFRYRFYFDFPSIHGSIWNVKYDYGDGVTSDTDTVNNESTKGQDTVEHYFQENFETGYTVTMTTELITSKLGIATDDLSKYGLTQCIGTSTQQIFVTDNYFEKETRELPVANRIPYQPNIFTPNGDGQNDLFYLNTNGVDVFDFMIYNRWGSLVYELKNIKRIEWTGINMSSEPVETGTYFYVVVSNKPDGRHEMKGMLSLFR